MTRRSRFDLAFDELRGEFRAATKRRFLDDIRDQLEEDPDRWEMVTARRGEPQLLAVSFDRRTNDGNFSYHYFDLVLVALDHFAGGAGIIKPVSQLRVLRWNDSPSELLKVLKYLMRQNSQIKARRLLILPYPTPVVGRRIDHDIYRR